MQNNVRDADFLEIELLHQAFELQGGEDGELLVGSVQSAHEYAGEVLEFWLSIVLQTFPGTSKYFRSALSLIAPSTYPLIRASNLVFDNLSK